MDGEAAASRSELDGKIDGGFRLECWLSVPNGISSSISSGTSQTLANGACYRGLRRLDITREQVVR